MKKYIFILTLILGSLSASFAQTEISGYLDSDPTDGISGTAVTMNFQVAVRACRILVHDGKDDWYLPSYEEIALFSHGTSSTGPAPGCIGINCNWISSPGNSAGTTKCWTRSVSSLNGHQSTYGSNVAGGLYTTIQDHVPNTVCAARCVR